MIPSVLAAQLKQGLTDYITTTFPVSTPGFKGCIERFLETPGAVFHDPHVSVRLPFRVSAKGQDRFPAIHQAFAPYVHQEQAFERLSGEDSRSTLVATGTGSGKTECFLYPILDYCWRHRGEHGIKALIIYPMNALAVDQARRLAELIDGNADLKGNVTAGMYVGGHDAKKSSLMGPDTVITDPDMMRQQPPDILLTNYKMLDYLLVRPRDAQLWRDNRPDTLKYIVVDELHTFDGAQGTDLACLLRRLKSRLFTPKGYLTCVGTSATMGAGDDAAKLTEYATQVFGEIFDPDSVITEDRLSVGEFLQGRDTAINRVPTRDDARQLLHLAEDGDEQEYLRAAYQGWFGEDVPSDVLQSDAGRIDLSDKLCRHAFFKDLLGAIGKGNAQYTFVVEQLGNRYPVLRKNGSAYACAVLDALLALVSHARSAGPGPEHPVRPFLQVQVQVWLRELRRVMGKVEPEVTLALADDLNDEQKNKYLPVVNCRDCGATGWASLLLDNNSVVLVELRAFYNAFFRQDKRVVMLFPRGEAKTSPHQHREAALCIHCLHVDFGTDVTKCQNCGSRDVIPVWQPSLETEGDPSFYTCPFCGSRGGLSLIGSQSATLISAGVSEICASRFNDDKKILAFSDNVQDASHRAGFFNARTWRFALRSAIQKFVAAGGEGLPLGEFAAEFVSYWRRRMTKEEFAATFTAPNLTWRKAYEQMLVNDALPNDEITDRFLSDIRHRLELEVFLEYGMHARVGRSLEKSGASVIALDREMFDQAVLRAHTRITNEIGELHGAGRGTVAALMAGMLLRLKNNGGFHRRIYEAFIRDNGKTIWLSNKKTRWMPGLTRGRTVPRFLAREHVRSHGSDPFDVPTGKSWYAQWTRKTLHADLLREDVPDEVNRILVAELRDAGILTESHTKRGVPVWSISPDAVRVTNRVAQIACDRCGHALSLSQDDAPLMVGAPCYREECDGHYVIRERAGLDFYGKLYSTGDLVRINADEHTGLLNREDREELENRFKRRKADHKPWDPNLLSCTPTLEMGIDVGDLSTVVLCDIPPTQAQYLQRVGRAGRRDGNALAVAVVNARPHDLYFFQDPLEMLDGQVQPPGVFLNASAVLERQFVAYCFDCWVRSGIPEGAIPLRLQQSLSTLAKKPVDRFPFNFLTYIRNNLSLLNRSFVLLFDDQLSDDSKAQLQVFSYGKGLFDSPLDMRILGAFQEIADQREALRKDIKRLGTRIQELEAKPEDSSFEEEIRSLKIERGGLQSVVKMIDNTNIFNFLSDEGLLPNYAFPEAGIILRTVIYRKLASDGDDSDDNKDRQYQHYSYDYSRPAASAIREFAPENSFYAGGRRLSIDQVDVSTVNVEKWRLCPLCSHAQLEVEGKDVASCPHCGSPAWADQGQVKQMLKVRMVYSNVDYAASRSGDESDDRDVKFYCNQTLVDVDESKDVVSAYKIDDGSSSFGFEFVRKATIREINFGEIDAIGPRLMVAGKDDVRKGFRICRRCGKVQHGKKPVHTNLCPARNDTNEANFEEYLYLYREFTSEAIRILIPSTTFDTSDTRRETFIASIMLGLKRYFGTVEHLRACVCREPVPDSDYQKNYLVLYDTVPGGTGYLKQVMRSEKPMMDILQLALDAVEACSCGAIPDRDGCYKCLYAYKQSAQIGQISRRVALEMLRALLAGKDHLVKIPSIGHIKINSLLESELERRFLEALEHSTTAQRPVEVHKQLVNMKEGYYLRVGDMRWLIEPQVELGPAQGIPVVSRADFMFWPARSYSGVKPVAVFTDGYAFHRDIAGADTLKRMAIARSGVFRVWSLSWKDVQQVFEAQGDYYTRVLSPMTMPNASAYTATARAKKADDINPGEMNAFALLLEYLGNENSEERFLGQANAYAMALVDPKKHGDTVAFDMWKSDISTVASDELVDLTGYDAKAFFGTWRPPGVSGNITVYTGISWGALTAKNLDHALQVAVLEDRPEVRSNSYEADWNGFFGAYNLLQSLPGCLFVTQTGIEKEMYTALCEVAPTGPAPAPTGGDLWTDVLPQIFDAGVLALAKLLAEKGLTAPTAVGYELGDDKTGVLGQAELAWEDRKVAVLSQDQAESSQAFAAAGWSVALAADPDSVIALLTGQEGNDQ